MWDMFDVPECQQIQIRKPENTCVYVCRKKTLCASKWEEILQQTRKQLKVQNLPWNKKKYLHVLFVQTCQKTIADSSTSLAIVGCQER